MCIGVRRLQGCASGADPSRVSFVSLCRLFRCLFFCVVFFLLLKQKTAYECLFGLVGSERWIRDRCSRLRLPFIGAHVAPPVDQAPILTAENIGCRLDNGHDVGPACHEFHRELQVERPVAGNQHAFAG